MWVVQALQKAGKAKNTAGKSVEIISSTVVTVENILAQIGECVCIPFTINDVKLLFLLNNTVVCKE